MSEAKDPVAYKVHMENAVLIGEFKVDLVEAARAASLKSENTIDDVLVKILEMAAQGLDWKGYAKGAL